VWAANPSTFTMPATNVYVRARQDLSGSVPQLPSTNPTPTPPPSTSTNACASTLVLD
jgi:hypothetical protein